jgi:hypothetical protein
LLPQSSWPHKQTTSNLPAIFSQWGLQYFSFPDGMQVQIAFPPLYRPLASAEIGGDPFPGVQAEIRRFLSLIGWTGR